MWADPVDDPQAMRVAFSENKERDCSVKFGLKPVKQLLKKSNFLSIIRAHQPQAEGFKMHRWGVGLPLGHHGVQRTELLRDLRQQGGGDPDRE